MTATREQQLEDRVAQLEHTVAALIRATLAAVSMLGSGNLGFHTGGGGPWSIWERAGAEHQAVVDLHAHLQRNPPPQQD